MNNLSSYFGLVDAKIRAFDKNLPVLRVKCLDNFLTIINNRSSDTFHAYQVTIALALQAGIYFQHKISPDFLISLASIALSSFMICIQFVYNYKTW